MKLRKNGRKEREIQERRGGRIGALLSVSFKPCCMFTCSLFSNLGCGVSNHCITADIQIVMIIFRIC
jgi:hypothetical protein